MMSFTFLDFVSRTVKKKYGTYVAPSTAKNCERRRKMETTASMSYPRTSPRLAKINLSFLTFWVSYLALIGVFIGYVLS